MTSAKTQCTYIYGMPQHKCWWVRNWVLRCLDGNTDDTLVIQIIPFAYNHFYLIIRTDARFLDFCCTHFKESKYKCVCVQTKCFLDIDVTTFWSWTRFIKYATQFITPKRWGGMVFKIFSYETYTYANDLRDELSFWEFELKFCTRPLLPK